MSKVAAKFTAAFAHDLKQPTKRKSRDVHEPDKVIDLVLENTPEALEELGRGHRMHALSGA